MLTMSLRAFFARRFWHPLQKARGEFTNKKVELRT